MQLRDKVEHSHCVEGTEASIACGEPSSPPFHLSRLMCPSLGIAEVVPFTSSVLSAARQAGGWELSWLAPCLLRLHVLVAQICVRPECWARLRAKGNRIVFPAHALYSPQPATFCPCCLLNIP